MCIIINRKENDAPITNKWLRAFWEKNNDGWGIMFNQETPQGSGDATSGIAPDAPPIVRKGLTYDAFKAEVRRLEASNVPFIAHLRMATHGAVNTAMLHPFELGSDMWFMHNGIVDYPAALTDDPDDSDTCVFVAKVLKPLMELSADPSALIRSDSFRYLLESHLGSQNRAVIMDRAGYVIYNPTRWHVIQSTGLHVSNTYAWADPYAKPLPVHTWPKKQASLLCHQYEPADPLIYDPSVFYDDYLDDSEEADLDGRAGINIAEGDVTYHTLLDAVYDSPEGAARALFMAEQRGLDIWTPLFNPA